MSKKTRKIILLSLFIVLLYGMGMTGVTYAENNIKQALIVVDPGGSGFSLKVAQTIADQLAQKDIIVSLIKVKQAKVIDLTGKDLLVIGGPTYMAQPSGAVKKFVASLNHHSGLKTLLFQTGGTDGAGLAPLTELVKSKGLLVIGSCIIITPKENAQVESKVKQLIANL